MINFEDFKYNKASIPVDAVEKLKYFKQLEDSFAEEIKNSETAKEYFSNYRPEGIESFIKFYTSRKVLLVQCQDYYSTVYHEKEISELGFQKKAEDMLKLILQKKLFNIQLRWRAGQIEIDGIDTTYDFRTWEGHVLSCPFIPAISSREVELLKEYLLRFCENDQINIYDHSWQDYDELTKKSENGLMDDYPNWYEFYDSRMGTGALLILPDHKGAMENFYFDLVRQATVIKSTASGNTESAPYLYAGREEISNFVRYFEQDKHFRALFKYYNYCEEKENRDPNYDDLEQAIRFLLTADRPVYPNAHLTWDKAILAAAKEYENARIVEAIDFVFDEYQMMKELGFSKEKSSEEKAREQNEEYMAQFFRKNILKGRMLNGEPEDFDY